MAKAMPNSRNVGAPKKIEPIVSIESTGKIEVIEVLMERIRTWLSDRFIISV